MKRTVKISAFIVIIVLSLCIFAGCINDNDDKNWYTQYFYTEYFRYYFWQNVPSQPQYAVIAGLTEEGKQQKYLVIPDEIDGREVKQVYSYFGNANFEKMYFSKNINFFSPNGRSNVVKLIFINSNCPKIDYLHSVPLYYSEYAEEEYGGRFFGAKTANVTYLLNYYNSDNNGIYFVDDLEEGESIGVIPENPTREGHIFTGWYLEKECENKIDLKTFTYSEEKGNVTFYADWLEI